MSFAASLLLALVAPGMSATPDDPATVRAFLEAFASNPDDTSKFMTEDAMIAVGDIGGPYAEFMKEVRPKGAWISTCRVTQLQEKPAPSADQLKDSPPWMQGGRIALFEGTYNCTQPNGSKGDVKLAVVLKDEKVAMFHFWWDR